MLRDPPSVFLPRIGTLYEKQNFENRYPPDRYMEGRSSRSHTRWHAGACTHDATGVARTHAGMRAHVHAPAAPRRSAQEHEEHGPALREEEGSCGGQLQEEGRSQDHVLQSHCADLGGVHGKRGALCMLHASLVLSHSHLRMSHAHSHLRMLHSARAEASGPFRTRRSGMLPMGLSCTLTF